MNQLLESISTHRIDRLILDPVWMEEPIWWTPVLQALAMAKIPWSMLLPTLNDLKIWDLGSEPRPLLPPPWPLCVTVGEDGQLWHAGDPVRLTPQQRALLEVIAVDGDQKISLESVNRARALRGEAAMSGQSFRVQLHGIRKALGAEHLINIRRLGYRWLNCGGPAPEA